MCYNKIDMSNVVLLISCPDARGIVAKVSNFIYNNGGNVENSDQHIDSQTNTFFMRIEWSLNGFKIGPDKILDEFRPLRDEFAMNLRLYQTDAIPAMAIFVSKYAHCLYDLLLRYKSGQFACTIPLIVSNHPHTSAIAEDFGIEFMQFPITEENKLDQEKKEIEILKEKGIDLVALARYTQVLSKQFIDAFPRQIINIHHSFLPAFAGAAPYKQAYTRGVKIIGATSHYVTEELDAGAIIDQDTVRVSHRDSFSDLVRKGEDLEKIVLSRAVKWHLERKILVYNNKTVVFD